MCYVLSSSHIISYYFVAQASFYRFLTMADQGQVFWGTRDFELQHISSDTCVDGGAGDANPVTLKPCDGKLSQRWDYIDETIFPDHGWNVTMLRNRKTGLCIDYKEVDIDGLVVITAPCSTSCTQRWVVNHSERRKDQVHAKLPRPIREVAAPKSPKRLTGKKGRTLLFPQRVMRYRRGICNRSFALPTADKLYL